MRILITGAGGLLGGRLCEFLGANHDIHALVRTQRPPEGILAVTADLSDPDRVEAVFKEARPEVVIHAAALADAEVCEREPERAERDNVTATRNVARGCASAGARLITISTDLVLDGQSAFSSEESEAHPLTVYGRSKLRSESVATNLCPDAVVLRTSLVCGRGHGKRLSASEAVAQRLMRGEEMTLYDDEWRTPVDSESVAVAIESVMRAPRAAGLFHLGGSERLTRLELGERVASVLELDARLIQRASRNSHPGAPRPRDVSFGIERARVELGWTPRPLETALREGRL